MPEDRPFPSALIPRIRNPESTESEIDTLGSMLNDSDSSRVMERSKKSPSIKEMLLKNSKGLPSSDSLALELEKDKKTITIDTMNKIDLIVFIRGSSIECIDIYFIHSL